jgi:hypothetical protein
MFPINQSHLIISDFRSLSPIRPFKSAPLLLILVSWNVTSPLTVEGLKEEEDTGVFMAPFMLSEG